MVKLLVSTEYLNIAEPLIRFIMLCSLSYGSGTTYRIYSDKNPGGVASFKS